ncbi:hypothetical protein, partial [uncultured Sutterella sp.]|uniref:hypothetical protein n=1 Tax=uncultured Sutterella sp. TaxID=286133 RepID=UPI00266EB8FB
VSTQVLPSRTAPTVTFNTAGGNDVQYTAPTNGWIEIDFAIANATEPEVITCGIQTTTLTYAQVVGFRLSCSAPIAKGELARCYGSNTVSQQIACTMTFRPAESAE